MTVQDRQRIRANEQQESHVDHVARLVPVIPARASQAMPARTVAVQATVRHRAVRRRTAAAAQARVIRNHVDVGEDVEAGAAAQVRVVTATVAVAVAITVAVAVVVVEMTDMPRRMQASYTVATVG